MSSRRLPLCLIVLSLLAGGCGSTLRSADFATATPRFDPVAFFEGPVRSWGVIESRMGAPRSRLRAELVGRRVSPDEVEIAQNFTFEGGRTQQRLWRIRRVDAHRFDATSGDVIGPARGYASGNSFRWEYTLQLRPGNFLSRVRMEHWMYLLEDGETLLNRVVIRKFGLVVAQTTEYFRKGRGSVPAVDRP